MSFFIDTYREAYSEAIIQLILPIQQELGVPITLHAQPDLLSIPAFYFQNNGNFWVAVQENTVIGTIALIDMGNHQAALRKMFVHQNHRGKEKGVAQALFNELLKWCRQKNIQQVFLGTIHFMSAALRFYQKNNFVEIPKENLPASFPLMQVDDRFFVHIVKNEK